MTDVIKHSSDLWVDEISSGTDIKYYKENNQPIPGESTNDNVKNSDKGSGHKVFKANNSFKYDVLHKFKIILISKPVYSL